MTGAPTAAVSAASASYRSKVNTSVSRSAVVARRLPGLARLEQHVANVRVRNDAFLERTVVNDNAYLGEAVRLRGTVVGRSCDLRKGVRTEEGVFDDSSGTGRTLWGVYAVRWLERLGAYDMPVLS